MALSNNNVIDLFKEIIHPTYYPQQNPFELILTYGNSCNLPNFVRETTLAVEIEIQCRLVIYLKRGTRETKLR